MAAARTVDLAPIIDRQKIGSFHVKLIIIAFIVVMVDGYDIGAAAIAAPALVREWHFPPAQLGGLFSAGLLAGLFGPLMLGWLSDHYGRRSAIIVGSIYFGAVTWASVLAQELNTL
ncbi:MAG TPA: MFS transporter, partial [Stellaceae bacterium]|nr:MFS transporter [Stellaceae bacterium]